MLGNMEMGETDRILFSRVGVRMAVRTIFRFRTGCRSISLQSLAPSTASTAFADPL